MHIPHPCTASPLICSIHFNSSLSLAVCWPLRPEHPSATTHPALPLRALRLHLLAHLHIDVEKLGHAAVEADGFTFAQVRFAILRGDAFAAAGVDESGVVRCVSPCTMKLAWEGKRGKVLVEHVGDHFDFGLCCLDLLFRGGLRAAAAETEEGHC